MSVVYVADIGETDVESVARFFSLSQHVFESTQDAELLAHEGNRAVDLTNQTWV